MEQTKNTLPEGYIRCVDPNGSSFAVPQFLVPAAHNAFDAFRQIGSVNNQIHHKVWHIVRFLLICRHNILLFDSLHKGMDYHHRLSMPVPS
jgi:hypothetical protein